MMNAAQILAEVEARLRSGRHEAGDHLNRELLVKKLKPSSTIGHQLRTVDGRDAAWMPPSGGLNVKDYGALGDGSTNDTTALTTAIAAADGDTLIFPPGTYMTTGLTVATDTCLYLMSGAIVKLTASGNNDVILLSGNGSSVIGLGAVDGNRANNTTGSCIKATGDNIVIHGITVQEANEHGIELSSVDTARVSFCLVDGADSTGIYTDSSSTNLVIANNSVTDCTVAGIQLVSSSYGTIAGNSVDLAAGIGIKFDTCTYMTLTGNVFNGAGTGTRAVYVDTTYPVTIVGNVCHNWTTHGVYITASTAVTITDTAVVGNQFKSCGTAFGSSLSGGAVFDTTTTANKTIVQANAGFSQDILHVGKDVLMRTGTNSPESASTAGIGSIFLRRDGAEGTTAYLKESGTGNTGWSALVTQSRLTNYLPEYNNGAYDFGRNGLLRAYSSLATMTVDPVVGSSTKTMTDGTAYFVPVYLDFAQTLTGVAFMTQTAGDYTADNNSKVGLYSTNGTTLTRVAQSADDTTLWKATAGTNATKAFSGTYAASAGIYYIAILYNSSAQVTAPVLYASVVGSSNVMAFGQANSDILAGGIASQTDLPSSQALSGLTKTTQTFLLGVY